MRKIIVCVSFLLLLVPGLSGSAAGAMDRTQICIQQYKWHQARGTPHSDPYPGFVVWSPLGTQAGRWAGWRFDSNPGYSTDGINAYLLEQGYAATFRPGYYYYCGQTGGQAVTKNSWFNDYSIAWNFWHTTGTTALVFAVPANTTRFYLVGMPHTNGGTATITCSGGAVVVSTVSFNDGSHNNGQWMALSASNGYCRTMEYMVQVAGGFGSGGGTVTVTPTADATYNESRVIGAIAITSDTDTSNPDVGVYDPATLLTIGPAAVLQPAVGQISWQYNGGGGIKFFGEGHFTSGSDLGTLTNGGTETIVYGPSDTAFAWQAGTDSSGNTGWQTIVTSSFRRTLTGVINGGSGKTNLGTWTGQWAIDRGGCRYRTDAGWNASAVSATVQVQNTGYAAEWSMNPRFTRFRFLPEDTTAWPVTLAGSGADWDATGTHAGGAVRTPRNAIVAYDPASGLTAMMIASSSDGIGAGYVRDYASGSGFPKMYLEWGDEGRLHAVANGELSWMWYRRTLTDVGGIEGDYPSQAYVRTGTVFRGGLIAGVDDLAASIASTLYSARIAMVRTPGPGIASIVGADVYTTVWFKAGNALVSGVSDATIHVVDLVTGADVVATSAMSAAGTSGAWSYAATGGAMLQYGQSASVTVSATIDGATRTWTTIVTRSL